MVITCNRLVLETLGFGPIMPKIPPRHSTYLLGSEFFSQNFQGSPHWVANFEARKPVPSLNMYIMDGKHIFFHEYIYIHPSMQSLAFLDSRLAISFMEVSRICYSTIFLKI
jgi:hypothetical protein